MLDRHQQSESPTLAYMSDLEHGTKLEVKNNPVIVGTGHFGGPRPRWPLETVSLQCMGLLLGKDAPRIVDFFPKM